MEKKEFKTGDIIKIDEKHYSALRSMHYRNVTLKNLIEELAVQRTLLRKEFWIFLKNILPEETQQFRMSMNHCTFEITLLNELDEWEVFQEEAEQEMFKLWKKERER